MSLIKFVLYAEHPIRLKSFTVGANERKMPSRNPIPPFCMISMMEHFSGGCTHEK